MSGYVFWCSGCKIRHAGECEEVPSNLYPSPGTRWGMQDWIDNKWMDRKEYLYVVVDFDAAESQTVLVEAHVAGIRYGQVSLRRAAWDFNGHTTEYGRYRMVKYD